jgi:LacI family transcriptional regulator
LRKKELAVPQLYRVAVIVETSRQLGRELLRGIIQYQSEVAHWSIGFQPHSYGDAPPAWLERWEGDGILARIVDEQMAEAVLAKRLPVVDLRAAIPELGVPHIEIANDEIVRLAVDHLWDCGFRMLGFCGLRAGQNRWMDDRRQLFERAAAERGAPCHVRLGVRGQDRHASLRDERAGFMQWLAKLPMPIGIMAANDDHGQQLLDACQVMQIRVPDQVAVIGVDNDEFLCNLSHPPLSSIEINLHGAGYQAAATLNRLMSGQTVRDPTIRCLPRRVAPRASTDIRMFGDPDFEAALSYIRQNACQGIDVGDVVRRLSVSRRVLERRFQALLGRSPNSEIVRVRLERAKELLAETQLPISEIAQRVGFASASYLCHVFRAQLGTSLGEFRGTARKAGGGLRPLARHEVVGRTPG